jgi:hypothetical protein
MMKFNTLFGRYAALLILAGLVATLTAQGKTHYVNGVEGIKAGTVPPPGYYWRLYGVYYSADEYRDGNGDKAPIGFNVDVSAIVNRFIWSTPLELLGGNYVCDIIVPYVNVDLKVDASGYDKSRGGLGDICVEPLILSWHGARYDAAAGVGLYLPTGRYDENEAANPGEGMWTGMGTLGGTLYFDQEKTWSASVLSRYEKHSKVDGLDFEPGDDFHFEWGLGKTIAKFYDVGLTGYCQWQVTENEGEQAPYTTKDRVFSAGPEVAAFFPKWMLAASLRTQWEFEARERSQGHITTLTLTKIF